MRIVEPAPAKLNLALHLRARRPDGYHELETLFVFTRDGDEIEVAASDADSFEIEGPFAEDLATGDDNLVIRARDRFRSDVEPVGPLAITLVKRLPIASGIGGGSADAAAVLRALARMAGVASDDPRLMACAAALGSDVPACLLGRPAIGRGRGEELTLVEGIPGTPVLLVNPRVPVSTAQVFAGWDGIDRGPIGAGSLLARALAGRNDMEPAARAIAPVIGEVLSALSLLPGVMLARMSGSGATCFALFHSPEALAAGAATIRADHPDWWCLETVLA